MCGIAGFSRAADRSSIADGRQFAAALALAVESRGKDATGMAWSSSKHAGHPYYAKETGPARKTLNKLVKELPTGIQSLLVHTRAATQGSPKEHENNHPISVEDITLTHNGMCSNDYELLSIVDAHELRIGEVDSEAIAWLLSLGPEALGSSHVVDLLELVEGCASLAWYDLRDPSYAMINLARLRGRPLAIGWTKKGDLVYASTPEALELASKIAKVNIRSVFEMQEGTYYHVAEGEIVEDKKFTPVPAWTSTWKTSTTMAKTPKVQEARLSLIDRIENELALVKVGS